MADPRPAVTSLGPPVAATLAPIEQTPLMWAGLYLRIHQIMSLRNDRDVHLADSAANHPPIVRALAVRDGALAERLISEHTHALASFDPASVAERLP